MKAHYRVETLDTHEILEHAHRIIISEKMLTFDKAMEIFLDNKLEQGFELVSHSTTTPLDDQMYNSHYFIWKVFKPR